MSNKKPPVHTTPNPQGKGWVNQQGGEIISKHRTKENAIERGRQEAIRDQTEHRIHNLDGKIKRSNSYGPDPNPPKDKNR